MSGYADRVVDLLLERAPTLGAGRLLAVDGPAGSGKTTLAAAARAALADRGVSASTVHLDDLFEGWEGLRPELAERVEKQLLGPLSAGHGASWRRYDWAAGRFDGWVDQPVVDVLVLEGCGSGAQAYAPYLTLLVWVEAAPATRLARGIARDGESVRPRWLAWMDLESAYFAEHRTRARADLRIAAD